MGAAEDAREACITTGRDPLFMAAMNGRFLVGGYGIFLNWL